MTETSCSADTIVQVAVLQDGSPPLASLTASLVGVNPFWLWVVITSEEPTHVSPH